MQKKSNKRRHSEAIIAGELGPTIHEAVIPVVETEVEILHPIEDTPNTVLAKLYPVTLGIVFS